MTCEQGRLSTVPGHRFQSLPHGLQVLLAWSPLAVVLLAYAAAQWLNAPISDGASDGDTNRLGFALHVEEPVVADGWLFGRVPSQVLQEMWFQPGQAHWYDAVLAVVYASHFFVIPVTAIVLWVRNSGLFRPWLLSVMWMSLIGVAGYIAYPMSPPWLAAQLGADASITRISGIGWDYLGLNWVGDLLGLSQAASNPVAAMPSLHAAAALLLAGFLWPVTRWWVRSVLVLYAAAMALALVYTGEHYVIDVVAGWLTAALALWIAVRRSRAPAPRPPAFRAMRTDKADIRADDRSRS